MSRILVVYPKLPLPLSHGMHLRIFHLFQELSRRHELQIVVFEQPRQEEWDQCSAIFRRAHHIPPPVSSPSRRRSFRLSNASYLKSAYPNDFSRITRTLAAIVLDFRPDCVFVSPIDLAEYVAPLAVPISVVDVVDSVSLTLARKRLHATRGLPWFATLRYGLGWLRYRSFEASLSSCFDHVLTISPIDRDHIRSLSWGRLEAVADLPNGVTPRLEEWTRRDVEDPRSIIFWGNLDFAPNSTAVEYFYAQVYLPYLENKGYRWHIVGRNPTRSIERMAQAHSSIVLTGYVDDLYAYASQAAIVINPMQQGSGLKNKVLEAFALGKLVISNALGMEALPRARPGTHYVLAERAEEFAAGIERYCADASGRVRIGSKARELVLAHYTWPRIAEDFETLAGLRGGPEASGDSQPGMGTNQYSHDA